MRNVTIALDDQTYHFARVAAAEHGKSLSAFVKELLGSVLPKQSNPRQALDKIFAKLDKKKGHFSASSRLSRDQLYE